MAIVIHHPRKTVDSEITRWVDPAWAEHGLLQAYRVGAFDDPSIDVPDGGAALYNVSDDNLPKALSDGATLIADNLSDNSLGKSGRSAIEHYWGVQTPADVTSPADAIIRVVGRDAHPDGVLGPRPIMPGSDGRFRWVFAIIKKPKRRLEISELPQLVFPQKFNPALDRDSSHFAGRSHVLDVMKNDACEAIRSGDIELGRKIGGFNAIKCGVKPSEVADYAKEFIGTEFPSVKPKEPETRYDLTFTAADGTTVAGFTEVSGGWSIVSNKVETDTPGVDTAAFLRYGSALSGSDHYARADVTWENNSSSYAGIAIRCAPSAVQIYTMLGQAVGASDGLFRWDDISTVVTLVSVAFAITAGTQTVYAKGDGSVIYGEIGTSYALAFVDATYSGSYFGLFARAASSGLNHKFDNLTAEDFSGGVPVARLINGGRVHV